MQYICSHLICQRSIAIILNEYGLAYDTLGHQNKHCYSVSVTVSEHLDRGPQAQRCQKLRVACDPSELCASESFVFIVFAATIIWLIQSSWLLQLRNNNLNFAFKKLKSQTDVAKMSFVSGSKFFFVRYQKYYDVRSRREVLEAGATCWTSRVQQKIVGFASAVYERKLKLVVSRSGDCGGARRTCGFGTLQTPNLESSRRLGSISDPRS